MICFKFRRASWIACAALLCLLSPAKPAHAASYTSDEDYYSSYNAPHSKTAAQPAKIARPEPEGGRLIAMEENDYFASNDDRHYTQGFRLSYLSQPVTQGGFWDEPYIGIHDLIPFIFDGTNRKRKYEYTALGQSIFTPTNTQRFNPGPNTRPYAAWLYTGASLLQDTDQGGYHTLENAELLAGIIGPEALGAVTQNSFHQFIGDSASQGWRNEIHTEPGIMLTYEKKYRFEAPIAGSFGVDAIPEAGATVGNIMTYGQIGGIARIGQNLEADYGVDRIRPNVSGTGWFDKTKMKSDLGWYLYAGAQGRAVGQNIFLDGNTFQSSAHVDKKPLVADLVAGAALFWSSAVRIDATYTYRTKEFYGQGSHDDRFGGINFSFGF